MLSLGFAACGQARLQRHPVSTDGNLIAAFEQNLSVLKNEAGAHGWPSDHDCDAALWAGLARAAGATWVDLDAGLANNGQPLRRPASQPECYAEGASRSTISGDMILGLTIGAALSGDVDFLSKIYRYGEVHQWVMGEPWPEAVGEVWIKPSLRGLIARSLCHTTHDLHCPSSRFWPQLYTRLTEDFTVHLQVIAMYLDGYLGDDLAFVDLRLDAIWRLKQLRFEHPKDALIAALYGRYSGDHGPAIQLLLDPDYLYPSYVRGAEQYKLVHWLLAASVVLGAPGS